MNLVDAKVTEVLGLPYYKYGYYFVDVEYVSMSETTDTTQLMFKDKKEALQVKKGFEFVT